jgi:glyoxylase-like metal-dependent hydrolase (beta-lactamase superfamily II)
MPFTAGRFTLHEVRDGSIRLDGGAVFGVVPRVEWQKEYTPDDQNRIELAVRCLLIDTGPRKILVDDGAGNQPAAAALYSVERRRDGIDAELARAGVSRAEVTDVILTHLHLDHAGGTLHRSESGALELAFPNATLHLQRRNWKWAHSPSERDAPSYPKESLEKLEQCGQLHLLEGETELFPGVQVCVSEGHTVAMQLVRVQSEGTEVVFCGDLVPTAVHLKPATLTAFDLYPLTVIEEKRMLLAQAIESGAILFLEHDPHVPACRVREVDGDVVVDQVITL